MRKGLADGRPLSGARAPYKRFAAGETLAQGGIYFRRASVMQGFPQNRRFCGTGDIIECFVMEQIEV